MGCPQERSASLCTSQSREGRTSIEAEERRGARQAGSRAQHSARAVGKNQMQEPRSGRMVCDWVGWVDGEMQSGQLFMPWGGDFGNGPPLQPCPQATIASAPQPRQRPAPLPNACTLPFTNALPGIATPCPCGQGSMPSTIAQTIVCARNRASERRGATYKTPPKHRGPPKAAIRATTTPHSPSHMRIEPETFSLASTPPPPAHEPWLLPTSITSRMRQTQTPT